MALIAGSSQMKLTASCVPWITLSTPLGMPASSASSASRIAVSGTRSEGLSTNVLPHTVDIGNIHSGIIAGKLNGAMPPHTPSGTRYEWMSMPVPTFCMVSPIWREVVEHACSTTSSPRKMSPLASSIVLPCSIVRICASSSVCSRISDCSRNMTRVRLETEVLAQPEKAALADATASSISRFVAIGVCASTRCVAGQSTRTKSVDSDSINSPLMSSGTLSGAASSFKTAAVEYA
mmetsp:Transcript_48691/g.143821  ORF Transcript_48691/g.143821 Transcript_48691/m.143821 type:complete len:235 (-) Transcript_48691:124-828(-)